MAEGEGFEPPIRFPVQWFSRPPPSTTRPSLRVCSLSFYRFNHFAAAHERAQGVRNDDRAVLLLIVLENRNERAADRQTRSIQRVDVLCLACAVRPELDVRATRLESLAVRTGRNLPVR